MPNIIDLTFSPYKDYAFHSRQKSMGKAFRRNSSLQKATQLATISSAIEKKIARENI